MQGGKAAPAGSKKFCWTRRKLNQLICRGRHVEITSSIYNARNQLAALIEAACKTSCDKNFGIFNTSTNILLTIVKYFVNCFRS